MTYNTPMAQPSQAFLVDLDDTLIDTAKIDFSDVA